MSPEDKDPQNPQLDPGELLETQLDAAVGGTTVRPCIKAIEPCIKVIVPCVKVRPTT